MFRFEVNVVYQSAPDGMQRTDVHAVMGIVEGHDEGDVHDAQTMVAAEDADEALAHVAVDAALHGVVNGWHSTLHLEKNVEEPF